MNDKAALVIASALVRLIEPVARGGLEETPKRVAKAWGEWFGGYDEDVESVLKVFEDGAEHYVGQHSQLVVVRDIPIYSHCEHHLAPFFGVADIGYIPQGKVVGLSKLTRVSRVFARRLQVQERLGNQIADALQKNLEPLGVAVVLRCRHLCMESRGVATQGQQTVTSALRGIFMTSESARSEFTALIR